jgi:hypothetical protein
MVATVFCAVGYLWYQNSAYEDRLGRAQDEIDKLAKRQNHAPERVIRNVYYVTDDRESEQEAQAPIAAAVAEPAADVAEQPPEPELQEIRDLTPTERTAIGKERLAHIEGVMNSLSDDAEYHQRTAALGELLAPTLSELDSPELSLGEFECRGRMCAVDVRFEQTRAIAPLSSAADRAVAEVGLEHGPPLVHLVTYPTEDGSENVGRMYFEWLR